MKRKKKERRMGRRDEERETRGRITYTHGKNRFVT